MKVWRLRSLRIWVKSTSLQTLLCIFCLAFLGFAELLFLIKEIVPPILVLSLATSSGLLGFAALIIHRWSIISVAWKSPITKIAVIFVTFCISAYSLRFADDMIVQYTQLSPLKFSRAQTLLASVIAPILWTAVFALVFAGLYFLQAFVMIKGILLSNKRFMRLKIYRVLRIVFSLPIKPQQTPNTILEAGQLVGLAMMAMVVTPALLSLAASNEVIERPFRQLFILSSFYTNNGACPALPNTAEISLLDDGNALSVLDQDTLSIHIANCRKP